MKKLLITICAIACTSVFAELKVAEVFGDDMVLQRELPVTIWGTADPGESISVSFAGQKVATLTGPDGKWMLQLAPLKASKTGRTMTVKGGNTVTCDNVVVGEVWLCSGQSNMAGRFVESKGRRIDPEVFKKDVSLLRCNNRTGWTALTERSQFQFSCVAFYFGYELFKELDVPIGLIQRYNSGTPIQAWLPKKDAEAIRKRLGIPEDWKDLADNRNPGVQFEDKIVPIIPVTFRGTVWYQGERNAKAFTGWEYRDLLPFMVRTWRNLWAEKAGMKLRNYPFYYVQVPTQEAPVDGEWPWLRDAMRRCLDTIENSGMAIFYDYGPSLHPENKEPAGKRLALLALAKDYGQSGLVHCGPLLDKVNFKNGKARLSFTHVGGGLRNKTGGKYLKFFELAGEDGQYAPAKAWIEGDKVIVTSDAVKAPAYVRYLFRKPAPDPEVSLINAEGLPASSFMTDDFLPPRP